MAICKYWTVERAKLQRASKVVGSRYNPTLRQSFLCCHVSTASACTRKKSRQELPTHPVGAFFSNISFLEDKGILRHKTTRLNNRPGSACAVYSLKGPKAWHRFRFSSSSDSSSETRPGDATRLLCALSRQRPKGSGWDGAVFGGVNCKNKIRSLIPTSAAVQDGGRRPAYIPGAAASADFLWWAVQSWWQSAGLFTPCK